MNTGRPLSRRDFLRLRRTERGKQLDLACRTLYMRCVDAAIESETPSEWEPSMGEPPAVIQRRSVDEILDSLEQELAGAQVLCLLDAEWLDNMPQAARVQHLVAAFTARGGRLEHKSDE